MLGGPGWAWWQPKFLSCLSRYLEPCGWIVSGNDCWLRFCVWYRLGCKAVQSRLRSGGFRVQRSRVRLAIDRVTDGNGSGARPIRRRLYSVPGPLHLWHIDGNHKLVRLVFVLYNLGLHVFKQYAYWHTQFTFPPFRSLLHTKMSVFFVTGDSTWEL